MALLRINHDPSRTQLALFGIVWLLFFGVWAAVIKWNWGWPGTAVVVAAVALIPPLVGIFAPVVLKGVYLFAVYAAFPIGWVISHLLLALVYYGLMMPIAFALRIAGYDPLHRTLDREASSYWRARPATKDKASYFRQY